MIEKYRTEAMEEIWSEETKYRFWWAIERAAVKGWVEVGEIPAGELEAIDREVDWSLESINQHEERLRHDMLAFLEALEEHLGERSAHVHRGLTSSDVKDTEQAMRMRDSLSEVINSVERIRKVLAERAEEHRMTVMIGRTHGVHAEPVTFGLKCLLWYEEFGRQLTRLRQARDTVSVGKISGAVGTYAQVPPQVEEVACRELDLDPAPVSNQILQRDRHAEVMTVLANLAGTIEKIATEVRNLQRTELLEVEEDFREGQKGSSAMPHKRNPITAERLTGQSRLLRGYAVASLETQNLWHERDLTNSSTERVSVPDAFHLIHYMAEACRDLLANLGVHEDRMVENLDATNGVIYSQRVMLALTEAGWDRTRAYEAVQTLAMESWEHDRDFRDLVRENEEIPAALGERLEKCFRPEAFLTHVDTIFERVLGQG